MGGRPVAPTRRVGLPAPQGNRKGLSLRGNDKEGIAFPELEGTLTPLIPLSPSRDSGPLGPSRERGKEKQRHTPAPRRRRMPLVWYWGEGMEFRLRGNNE